MGTLPNSADPDEMQHAAAFHQDLHCLLKVKQYLGSEINHNLKNFYLCSLKVHNRQVLTYCINIYEKSHQQTKGLN